MKNISDFSFLIYYLDRILICLYLKQELFAVKATSAGEAEKMAEESACILNLFFDPMQYFGGNSRYHNCYE